MSNTCEQLHVMRQANAFLSSHSVNATPVTHQDAVCWCTYRVPAAEGVPDLVLKHPRIFEYKLESPDAQYLVKGRARIQVDVLPLGPNGEKVAGVNYFRDVATFLESPVSPAGPAPL